MPSYLESALGATKELRERAEHLSKTISEAEPEVNYRLMQPVIEENVSLDIVYLLKR